MRFQSLLLLICSFLALEACSLLHHHQRWIPLSFQATATTIDTIDQVESLQDTAIFEQTKVSGTYPFGSIELATHRFPKGEFWLLDDANKNNDSLQMHQLALYKIWIFYLGQNPICTDCDGVSRFLPGIRTLEQANLEDDEGFFNHWLKFRYPEAMETFTDRYPDLGKYEIYYCAETDAEIGGWVPFVKDLSAECCATKSFEINSNGTLIFYDRKSRSAKVLRVHFVENLGDEIEYRFFYIEKSRRIHIHTGYGYRLKDQEIEDKGWAYSLVHSYDIKVRRNGTIVFIERGPKND